jgi:hypothetical protein
VTFDDLLRQIVELLQRQGQVSYGALKRKFALDDEYLQDFKDELIGARQVPQISGRAFDKATVLRVVHAYEQRTSWHTRRPAL